MDFIQLGGVGHHPWPHADGSLGPEVPRDELPRETMRVLVTRSSMGHHYFEYTDSRVTSGNSKPSKPPLV